MKILLDIDGVMVPEKSWKSPEIMEDGFPYFSSNAIASLQKIIAETGAAILLTTSHKANYSLNEWKSIFTNRGIYVEIDRIHDNKGPFCRKDEILNWAANHPFEEFVIIDDDKSLNSLPANLKERLVLTSSSIGLNLEKADAVIKFLKRKQLAIA